MSGRSGRLWGAWATAPARASCRRSSARWRTPSRWDTSTWTGSCPWYPGTELTDTFLKCRIHTYNCVCDKSMGTGKLIVNKGSFCNKSSSPRHTRSCWRPSGPWTRRTRGTWTGRSSPSCSPRRGRPSARRRWQSSAAPPSTPSPSPSTTRSMSTSLG